MRGMSPFTISGGGMGVFEGQPFGAAANMGMIAQGFMGDFGKAGGRKARKGGMGPAGPAAPSSMVPGARGRKVRKGGEGAPGWMRRDETRPSTLMRSYGATHSEVQDGKVDVDFYKTDLRRSGADMMGLGQYMSRSPFATRAKVKNGGVNVAFQRINLIRSGQLTGVESLPPGLPGSRGYDSPDMFGLGQTYARGYGHHMAARGSGPSLYYGNQALFGLGADPVPTGPLASKNAALVPIARAKLNEFKTNRALISKLQPTQQKAAMDIVKTLWWPSGFLRTGRYDLDTLAGKVESALAYKSPTGDFEPFYRMVISGTSITIDARYFEYLEAFQTGNRALRNYMKQFIVLPTQVTEREVLRTVGLDSATLLGQAAAAAAAARSSRTIDAVVTARTLADSARTAAAAEGDMGAENLSAANALYSEMEALAKQVGAPPAASSQQAGPAKFPILPVAIGGAVVLGLVTWLVVSKK